MLGLGENVLFFVLFCYFILSSFPFHMSLAILFISITFVISYLHREKTYWKRRGVPSPKENLLWGNMLDLRKAIHTYDITTTKQLGKTFGCRAFGKHELVSSDFDIVRQVLMKDFVCFANRTNFIAPNPKNEHNVMQNLLILKEEENWKRIRSLISPAFSITNVKKQIPIYNEYSKEFVQLLDCYASQNEKIPLHDVLSRLTLSIGTKCAFGIDINVLSKDSSSPFLESAQSIFNRFDFDSPRLVIMAVFPGLIAWLENITHYQFLANSELEFFKKVVLEELERRSIESDSKQDYGDFFQVLFNALQSTSIDGTKSLSLIEMIAQSFIYLITSFGNISFTAHLVLFILSKEIEIQETVRREIFDVIGDKDEVSYEDLIKLQYTNQVIQETMRMYPLTARVVRDCTRTTTIKGIEIEKGVMFSVPVYAIHMEEEYYPNPTVFDPNRFSPEEVAKRDPLTFLPFGYGPRNCIAYRYVEMVIRMAIVYSIRHFRFSSPSNTPGLAMDNRIAPILAIAFMHHLESKSLYCNPILYVRYVDDTFICAPSTTELHALFSSLNSQFPSIKFIMDAPDAEGWLAFLDTQVQIVNSSVETCWYSKPSSKHIFLHSRSTHPARVESNIVSNIISLVNTISSQSYVKPSRDKALSILSNNGYNVACLSVSPVSKTGGQNLQQ